MKFSYNWIRELAGSLDAAPRDLMRLVTMKTAECEGLEEIAASNGLPADSVIEVDNKSLTHRPDLWGHHGLAREVAAILGLPLRDPADLALLPPPGDAAIQVEISDLELCPRYSALVFDNVTIQPSPSWLQHRLRAVGLNPINNVVDVTNFVMAELAQPMHAFDAALLHGPTIFVRPAAPGESIAALNDESYTLAPSNLVIADSEGPIAIAGLIGGLHSAIGPATTRVVFESASFLASSVRKTSVQLKLRTDASMRFEKSQDPHNTVRALARAIALLREVSPGIRIAGGLVDAGGVPPAPPPINLPIPWLARKLGREIDASEVRRILTSLGFGIAASAHPDTFTVTVPSWRATKDISMKDDLVEEIGRIVGYDAITPRPPLVETTPPPAQPRRLLLRRLRAMAAAQGFTEVYNYSFVNEDEAARFGFPPAAHLRVLNPIVSDQSLLRVSLLPGIFRNLASNARHFTSFRLFEIGNEIHPSAAGLPNEESHLAAALFSKDDGAAGLFEIKRLAECLVPGCEARPAEARPFEHPQRAAIVAIDGLTLGRLFELHPSLGLDGRAAILDLDIASVAMALERPTGKYRPLRRFPTTSFDLSIVAPPRTLAAALQRELASVAGPEVAAIEYLRQFPISESAVSFSYRLTAGAPDRTLSSEDTTAVRAQIIERMREKGYELRV